jgi:hypothetical protein
MWRTFQAAPRLSRKYAPAARRLTSPA